MILSLNSAVRQYFLHMLEFHFAARTPFHQRRHRFFSTARILIAFKFFHTSKIFAMKLKSFSIFFFNALQPHFDSQQKSEQSKKIFRIFRNEQRCRRRRFGKVVDCCESSAICVHRLSEAYKGTSVQR